jgi:monothiol glutaredoxin
VYGFQSIKLNQSMPPRSEQALLHPLYVKGEFIGDSDIMMEMYENGELQQVVNA